MATRIPSEISEDVKARFWDTVDIQSSNECWLWTGYRNKAGYGVYHFNRLRIMAHRLSLIISGSPMPDGMICLHSCDNPSCVNPNHLRWGTDADNMRDMIEKGRKVVATKPNTPENIAIKSALVNSTKSHKALAKEFNMPRSLVYYILAGKKWRNVEPFIDPIAPLTTKESRGGVTYDRARQRGEPFNG